MKRPTSLSTSRTAFSSERCSDERLDGGVVACFCRRPSRDQGANISCIGLACLHEFRHHRCVDHPLPSISTYVPAASGRCRCTPVATLPVPARKSRESATPVKDRAAGEHRATSAPDHETGITTGVTVSRLVRTAASQVGHLDVSVYALQRGCLLTAQTGLASPVDQPCARTHDQYSPQVRTAKLSDPTRRLRSVCVAVDRC